MNDIVTAVYNLMGHPLEEKIDDERIKAKVDRIFEVSKKLRKVAIAKLSQFLVNTKTCNQPK